MSGAGGPSAVSAALSGILPWVLIALLAFTMSQRRFMAVGVRKRFATLQLALLVGLFWAATIAFEHFAVSDLLLLPVLALLAVVAVSRRDSIFIHRARCRACGARLPLLRILYHDDHLCPTCEAAATPPSSSEGPP